MRVVPTEIGGDPDEPVLPQAEQGHDPEEGHDGVDTVVYREKWIDGEWGRRRTRSSC